MSQLSSIDKQQQHLRSFLFADNLKLLAIQQSTKTVSDLTALENWIKVNKSGSMSLAEDKSLVLQFQWTKLNFSLNYQNFIPSENVKDLRILIPADLIFMSDLDEGSKNANNTFQGVRRHVFDLNYDANLVV